MYLQEADSFTAEKMSMRREAAAAKKIRTEFEVGGCSRVPVAACLCNLHRVRVRGGTRLDTCLQELQRELEEVRGEKDALQRQLSQSKNVDTAAVEESKAQVRCAVPAPAASRAHSWLFWSSCCLFVL